MKPWLSFGFLIPGYLERRALCSCRTVLGVLSLGRSCTVYPADYPGRSLSDESVETQVSLRVEITFPGDTLKGSLVLSPSPA